MRCVLVFDHSNDIIYMKYNEKFAKHIRDIGKLQGLITEEKNETRISSDIVVQIFSPLITSQRVMCCQFGNSYSSIQGDELNFAFEEYMGYIFVYISNEEVGVMKRFLGICVVLVRYMCGPDILLLKSNPLISYITTQLIDSWINLQNTEQLMVVEAVEQLIINRDLSSSTMEALKEAVEKLQSFGDVSKLHAMVFVQNKFLGLYSSKNASNLCTTDILFLVILGNINKIKEMYGKSEEIEDYYYPWDSSIEFTPSSKFVLKVLLTGDDSEPKCVPHDIYIASLSEGVNLIFAFELANTFLSSGLYDTFLHLHAMQTVQIQQDVTTIKPALDNLDIAIKKLHDGIKKTKRPPLDNVYKQFAKKWEFIRKKYMEFIKNKTAESLLRAESSTVDLLDSLKNLLKLSIHDNNTLQNMSQSYMDEIVSNVKKKLDCFEDFLKVKALRNFTLGSRDSLTINKYLEEFPGLVHFLYVDRTNHRLTAPTLDLSSEETLKFTKKRVWKMIEFSQNHLQEGHLSVIWKDTAFCYSYFLWFEDNSGTALKPAISPMHSLKPLPQPGILCGNFYSKLKETCFPKMQPNKIKCYELFFIHLGLVTPTIVLEQTRRLAATICEIRGHPHHSIDILLMLQHVLARKSIVNGTNRGRSKLDVKVS